MCSAQVDDYIEDYISSLLSAVQNFYSSLKECTYNVPWSSNWYTRMDQCRSSINSELPCR